MIQNRGQYVEFTEDEQSNLVIVLTEEGKENLSELLGTKDHEAILFELVEDILCNSEWEKPTPEEVGALTDSPIFRLNDDLYWFPEYQVCDELAELLDKGKVTFTKAK